MRQFNRSRLGMLLKVLPATLLFCLAKWGILHLIALGMPIPLWSFDLITGSLFGAATFVIAFILSGTLSDYRASEEMVAQIASTVESIQDTALFAAAGHPDYNPLPLSQGLIRVLQSVLSWLKRGESCETVMTALTDLNPLFTQLEAVVSGPIISRIEAEQGKLRLIVTRIKLIRDTDFLAPAYVLLQLFLVGAIIALLLVKGDSFSKTLVVSGFLFTSFLYLVALIRDLDNPFQYDGKSFVDVDLSPLDQALSRLQASLSR